MDIQTKSRTQSIVAGQYFYFVQFEWGAHFTFAQDRSRSTFDTIDKWKQSPSPHIMQPISVAKSTIHVNFCVSLEMCIAFTGTKAYAFNVQAILFRKCLLFIAFVLCLSHPAHKYEIPLCSSISMHCMVCCVIAYVLCMWTQMDLVGLARANLSIGRSLDPHCRYVNDKGVGLA